jgi:hypothetical protein
MPRLQFYTGGITEARNAVFLLDPRARVWSAWLTTVFPSKCTLWYTAVVQHRQVLKEPTPSSPSISWPCRSLTQDTNILGWVPGRESRS